MRIIPRRKRTWLLVLLGVVIVGAGAVWRAASEKSEIEERFYKIRIGMESQEVAAILWCGPTSDWIPSNRVNYHTADGETFTLDFDDFHRVVAMKFDPIPIPERFRRWWTRCFKSKPPF